MRKAFLLGAGLGTRLRPLTETLPKPLIPVFHRPLITYALDQCLAAGITDFAINTHYLPKAWPTYFPDGHYRGASLSFFHEAELLETGGGIKNIADWIGSDPVLVYNGDILTDCRLQKLLEAHQASKNVATLGIRSTGEALHIALDGAQVIDIRNLLGVSPGTHQFTGIYCLDPEILALIPAQKKTSVIPAFLELARQGTLGSALLDDGHWLDLGTRDSYLEAHGLGPTGTRPPLLASQTEIHPEAEIHPSATISHSVIGPGCQVGAQARVENSLLWPKTTVSPGAQLTNCIVHSSTPAHGTHQNADL